MNPLSRFAGDDAEGEDSELTADEAADGVTDLHVLEVTRVLDALVARLLVDGHPDGDVARQRAADAIVSAYAERFDPGHSGTREESVIDAEDRALATLESRIADRREELAAEREDATRTGWPWEVNALVNHPETEALCTALERVHDHVRDAGEAGLTDTEVYAAFEDAYRGTAKYATPRMVWQKWLPVLADAPDIAVVDTGLWTIEGDPLDDAALADAIDEHVPQGAAEVLPLDTIYTKIADDDVLVSTGYLVAALHEFTNNDREVWATEAVAAGTTGPEALAAIPGVEPPVEDAPMLRYVGDGDDREVEL